MGAALLWIREGLVRMAVENWSLLDSLPPTNQPAHR
jgi:hypothetical protein